MTRIKRPRFKDDPTRFYVDRASRSRFVERLVLDVSFCETGLILGLSQYTVSRKPVSYMRES